MGRQVVTADDVKKAKLRNAARGDTAAGSEKVPEPDEYKDRLLKYIPAEVVSLYLFFVGILRNVNEINLQENLGWAAFFVMLILTPIYLFKAQNVERKQQLFISTIAFAIWAFALGGPFSQLPYPWYHPIYGAMLLPLYTFIVAMFEAKK